MVRSELVRSATAPSILYWDWNATTPPRPEVLAAVARAQQTAWANPSSQHGLGQAARKELEDARDTIAGALAGVRARDVVFTGGGTEANNLALSGASAIVASRLEHPSVLRVVEAAERAGVPVAWVPVPESAELRIADVERCLKDLANANGDRVLVAAPANHELGTLQDVVGLAELAFQHGFRLHLDAAQTFRKLSQLSVPGAVSWSLAGHKIQGPKGIGALAWHGFAGPKPVLLGGAQERGLRPGTVSVALAAGFAEASRLCSPEVYARVEPLRNELERALEEHGEVHARSSSRLGHVSNLSLRGWTGERLVLALDQQGVCVSAGSACSVGTAQPAAAVEAALGKERAAAAVRLSFGPSLTASEVGEGLRRIVRVVTRGSRAGQPSDAT